MGMGHLCMHGQEPPRLKAQPAGEGGQGLALSTVRGAETGRNLLLGAAI